MRSKAVGLTLCTVLTGSCVVMGGGGGTTQSEPPPYPNEGGGGAGGARPDGGTQPPGSRPDGGTPPGSRPDGGTPGPLPTLHDLLKRAGKATPGLTVAMPEVACNQAGWSFAVDDSRAHGPPLDRILVTTWDPAAKRLGEGWDLVRQGNGPTAKWKRTLTHAEVGFGCDEKLSTTFTFFSVIQTWVSSPFGTVPRGDVETGSFRWTGERDKSYEYEALVTGDEAPSGASIELVNVFTGATHSAKHTRTERQFGGFSVYMGADYDRVGIGNVDDVLISVVVERGGKVVGSLGMGS